MRIISKALIENRIAKYIVVFIILLITNLAFSQGIEEDLEQYYNSSYEPSELNETSASRVKKLFKYYSKQNSEKSDDDYEEFVYRSNYFLEKLNKSGQIFYNDQISLYLNKLKDFLLEGHPKKDDIKVYLTRHPSFNAFTNDFGNIYVNIAAISKLSNEEELLAVLAHEISHILKKHTHKFEEYRKSVEGGAWRQNKENVVLERHAFSKEQEYEADAEGFKLLKDKGVNLEIALGIFDKLRYDLDPHISGRVDINLLAGNSEILRNFFIESRKETLGLYLKIEENVDDTLKTHPSTIKRKATVKEQIVDIEHGENLGVGDFQEISRLASFVVINTYIENGWYLECLDHVLRLRERYPSESYLQIAQAKLLLLLTQSKYNATPFSQFINDKGGAYKDSSFLLLKEMFLSYNAVDLNVMALLSLTEIQKKNKDIYLDRIQRYLIQFLYKYNANLFKSDGSTMVLKNGIELDSSGLRVNNLQLNLNLSKKQIKSYKKVVSDNGLIPVKMRTAEESRSLVKAFLSVYSLSSADYASIDNYKAQRAKYEQMLTLDKVLVNTNPLEALRYYKGGVYDKSTNVKVMKNTALVQSSNLYLKASFGRYFIDYKKSLELEEKMIPVLTSTPIIHKNYSNTTLSKVTMKDINYHYYLLIWMNERFMFNDLIYSAVDEQVQLFKTNEKIDYVLYNINAQAEKKFGKNKNITYGYNIFLDLDSEGITYISKVATREKGNYQIFKQLFHLSDFYSKK